MKPLGASHEQQMDRQLKVDHAEAWNLRGNWRPGNSVEKGHVQRSERTEHNALIEFYLEGGVGTGLRRLRQYL